MEKVEVLRKVVVCHASHLERESGTQAGGRGFVSMTTSKRESKREWRMGALDIRPENARDPDQEGGGILSLRAHSIVAVLSQM